MARFRQHPEFTPRRDPAPPVNGWKAKLFVTVLAAAIIGTATAAIAKVSGLSRDIAQIKLEDAAMHQAVRDHLAESRLLDAKLDRVSEDTAVIRAKVEALEKRLDKGPER